MIGLLCFVLAVLASPFKSKLRLEAENAVLRHQLNVVRRRLPGRVRLTNHDRWFLIQLYRWVPSILQVLTIVRPETLLRWHRAGLRCYWRWKSRPLGGRPRIDTELRIVDYYVTIVADCCGAASEEDHRGALKRFNRDYGQVVVSRDVIDIWKMDARSVSSPRQASASL